MTPMISVSDILGIYQTEQSLLLLKASGKIEKINFRRHCHKPPSQHLLLTLYPHVLLHHQIVETKAHHMCYLCH